MVVHKVNLYTDTSYDENHIINTYDQNQRYSSPNGMLRYKDIDLVREDLGTRAFFNHQNIPVGEQLDFSGERVKNYMCLYRIATYLVNIENNFHVPKSNVDLCPAHVNNAMLVEFSKVVRR